VLAPVLISVLMIFWGTLIITSGGRTAAPFRGLAWLLNLLGVTLALYTFMADAIGVAGQGVDVLRNVLPKQFNWQLFFLALLLMTAPVMRIWGRRWVGPEPPWQQNAPDGQALGID
jgi:hypothetical protein